MKKWTVLLLPFFLYACSFGSTLYNNFDYVVLWKVADYIKLDQAQKRQVTKATDQFIEWHRQNELPKYYQLVMALHDDLSQQTLTLTKTQAYQTEIKVLRDNLITYLQPVLPPLLASLSDQQLQDFLENMKEKSQERYSMDQETLLEELIERQEKWYGKLNADQLDVVMRLHTRRMAQRLVWQTMTQDWLTALTLAVNTSENRASHINQAIWSLFTTSRSNQYTEINEIFEIWSLSTDKQKEKVLQELEEIKALIEDCLDG